MQIRLAMALERWSSLHMTSVFRCEERDGMLGMFCSGVCRSSLPSLTWDSSSGKQDAAREFLLGSGGGTSNCELTSAQVASLEGWQLRALREELCQTDGAWSVETAIVNIANHATYGTIETNGIPTLLTNSKLYDLVGDKPVEMAAYWLAQGFAHPEVECGSTVRHPFATVLCPDSSGHLSLNEQRVLLGNGMHVAMVGSFFLYCLSFATPVA